MAGLSLIAPIVIASVQMVVDQVVADRLDLPLTGPGVTTEPSRILVGLLCAAVGQAFTAICDALACSPGDLFTVADH